MFTYHPVDVTSHLIVPISVSKWPKSCASCNSISCVLLYSTSCIYVQMVASWCSFYDNTECLILLYY